MYNIKDHPISWRILLYIGDIVGVTLSLPLFFWISHHIDAISIQSIDRVSILNSLFVVGLMIYYFQRTGLYRSRSFFYRWPMIRRLLLSLCLLVATYALMLALITPARDWSCIYLVSLYGVIVFVMVFVSREIIRFIEIRFLRSWRIERIAFVGWSFRLGKALKGMAHESLSNLTIVGYFSDPGQPDLHPPVDRGYQELGMLNDLPELLEKFNITSLVVDQRITSSDKLQKIELVCSDMIITLSMIPWSSEIWTDRLVVQLVGGVPLLKVKDLRHNRSLNKLLRRTVDIIGALVGFILSVPIIAILAILIKRESPGPIFYRQTRLGLRKEAFKIIKLRSMHLNAEQDQGAVWAVENDSRRLKIGEFMRKWNLDELPQFWNVLVGEMSLVGPRPERPEFVEEFRDSVHYYNLRHSCKPGMTGWAAVHGLRGNTSLEDRLDFDLYYIEHWSLLLDFKIMLMTLVSTKNAY